MKIQKMDHDAITSCQRRAFKMLLCKYKAGASTNNTMKVHSEIAVKCLQEDGASRQQARYRVARSLRDLRKMEIKKPSRTPWEK